MTHAYNELYIDEAMSTMGQMMRYVDLDCHMDINIFFQWFIHSGVAYQFETGNPKYIAGMSGAELAAEVYYRTKGERLLVDYQFHQDAGVSYWTGWIMCYYQWYRNTTFKRMVDSGLTIETVKKRYILHEADVSKFVEEADNIMQHNGKSSLQYYRKLAGLTQKELAELSGVPLRMIQLYEQRQNDINKARADYVVSMAQVLGCSTDLLLEVN